MLPNIDSEFDSTAKVTLLGREYTLKGDIEPDQMVRVSKYVDKKVNDLRNNVPGMDMNSLLLLVSLNLADELFQARQEDNLVDAEELTEMSKRAERLIHMLEDGLIGEQDTYH